MYQLTDSLWVTELSKVRLSDIIDLNKIDVVVTDVFCGDEDGLMWPTNRILAKWKNRCSIDILDSLNISYRKVSYIGKDKHVSVIHLNDNRNTIELSNLLFESGYVEYSQPDWGMLIKQCNNPYFDQQWNLFDEVNGYDINVTDARSLSSGDNVKVAVLDVGVELTHPDLVGNLILGYDAVDANVGVLMEVI